MRTDKADIDNTAWAVFFVRWVLGLIFGMAGWWKVFELTPKIHAQRMFVEGFAEEWIPVWLLWGLGLAIPFVELLAGALLCIGLYVRWAAIAVGAVLVAVTYGHLLQQALFDTTGHIFPRLVLLTFVLMIPRARDTLSVDAWIAGRRAIRSS